MYVVNIGTHIVNEWADNEINRLRLASGKYGVVEYTGETETVDGVMYEKGFAPKKPLGELKAAKLQELKAAFQNTIKTAHCMCALGFEVDANEDANTNIVGLITVMKEGETTMFRAYDNSFHEVSREDLITIRDNIIKNSQFLYQMKWGMESRINNAVSEEELNSLVWNY